MWGNAVSRDRLVLEAAVNTCKELFAQLIEFLLGPHFPAAWPGMAAI
jgi:hypothetical protein